MQIKKILWADDEIDLLKPHIMFLEKRGYHVHPVNSGEDAIKVLKSESYDIVLLDEMMTGLDGLTTLQIIKSTLPNLPVVMITKNEDEWLMDEAIGQQITNYLTKPVNPSQVLLACKNILEKSKLQSDHTTKSYLQDFQNISDEIAKATSIEDWYQINRNLINWNIRFDNSADSNLHEILLEQTEESNKLFTQFIKKNYQQWITSNERPTLSPDIFNTYLTPLLLDDKKVVFIVIDCLRFDQINAIIDTLYPYYNYTVDSSLSILPSATPYSRNAIFSGLFPDEISRKYSDIWVDNPSDESSLNQHEERLFRDQIKRTGFSNKSMSYHKILTYQEGTKLENRITDLKSVDIITIVVNFVDMLGHSRSESDVLKEMVPNESAYRDVVKSWFEKSWLLSLLNQIKSWKRTVVITSDHGTIRVKKPIRVKADRGTSTGVRYKFGRNLHVDSKSSLRISTPGEFGLPQSEKVQNYIIACDQSFYVYPNDYHYYINKFQDTFQHGGISLEEMIVPVIKFTGK
ncbi:MAG: PglZ domain-containing protein [Fidelibacterota bacterium]